MSNINLSDIKIHYDGQNLPVVNLLNKLQAQLQETAYLLATITETLGDLQAALINSTTLEFRVTLTKEELSKFRSLVGTDDNDRIRKAIMTIIQQGETVSPPEPAEKRSSATFGKSNQTARPVDLVLDEPAPDIAASRKSTASCPKCHSPLDVPELSSNQWSVEVKCEGCGAKSLMKPKA